MKSLRIKSLLILFASTLCTTGLLGRYLIPYLSAEYLLDGRIEVALVQENRESSPEQKASITIRLGNTLQELPLSGPLSYEAPCFAEYTFTIENITTVISNCMSPSAESLATDRSTGNSIIVDGYDITGTARTVSEIASAIAALNIVWDIALSANGSEITYTRNTLEAVPEWSNLTFTPAQEYGEAILPLQQTTGYPEQIEQLAISDIIVSNPREGEIFEITINDQLYTSSGVSVQEVINNFVLNYTSNPLINIACESLDQTARCSGSNGAQQLLISAQVIYPTEDITPPLVTLIGPASITIPVWGTYTELWANYIENRDGSWSIVAPEEDLVNTNRVGTYLLTYSYVDAANNRGSATREVIVADLEAPLVTIIGGDITIELRRQNEYTDLWAIYTDNIDGSGAIAPQSINFTEIGEYILTYSYTDAAGNIGTAVRQVTIVDSGVPSIILTTSGGTIWSSEYLITGYLTGGSSVTISYASGHTTSTEAFTTQTGLIIPPGEPIPIIIEQLAEISDTTFFAIVSVPSQATTEYTLTASNGVNSSNPRTITLTHDSGISPYQWGVSLIEIPIRYVLDGNGSDIQNTQMATVRSPVVFEAASGSVTMAWGTTLQKEDSSLFDATRLSLAALGNEINSGSLQVDIRGWVEFGDQGESASLWFSRPIRIDIPVYDFSGSTITVGVRHSGTGAFGGLGLTNTPNASCFSWQASQPSQVATVTGLETQRIATIYTCSASSFIAYTPLVTTTLPTQTISSGGGGGSSHISAINAVNKKNREDAEKIQLKQTIDTMSILPLNSAPEETAINPTASIWAEWNALITPISSVLSHKKGFIIDISALPDTQIEDYTSLLIPTVIKNGSRVIVIQMDEQGRGKRIGQWRVRFNAINIIISEPWRYKVAI